VQLARRCPDLRFNGDFSHWYAGHELPYGDVTEKLNFMQPVLERVRFIHGRIASAGCVQVAVVEDDRSDPVRHFREIWTRCFVAFLRTASPGDFICFTPELLGPPAYARTFGPNAIEESDRWQQAKLLARIARECFDDARIRLHNGT
jgi:hypothetical protein